MTSKAQLLGEGTDSVTVYCPNCGKPNTDEATQCVSCQTKLAKPQGKAGSRFKGTMMMSGLGSAAAPPSADPAPGTPPAGAPAQPEKNLAFQATMMGPMATPGVPGTPGAAPTPGGFGGGANPNAPKAGGFGAAPAPQTGPFGAVPGANAPAANAPAADAPAAGAPAPGGFGAAPATPAAAPAATGGFGAPPAGAPEAGGFGSAPAAGSPPAGSPPAAGGFGAGGAPAAGGFGAPPASAPASGGFGAPPAASPPASGGFGAPPAAGGPPAPGGFGAPPAGGSPAPGGFGAPPAANTGAAGGGFGAPSASGGGAPGGFGGAPGAPGGAPGGAGFGGPPAGGPPRGAPPSGSGGGSNAKIWIGVGVGCLLLSIIACVGSWYWCKSKFADGAGEMVGELNRLSLGVSLSAIKTGCMGDPSGAGAAAYFHPAAFSAYQSVVCQVNDQTIAAIQNSCTPQNGAAQTPCSNVTSATAAGDAGRAAGVGVDASTCFSFTSGTMRIVACNVEQGLKIIHLENPAGVQ